ncbi:gluconokinase [Flavimobilis sp. GY10621]|uniref:Gluconokinase n=1 Tax=Flavimobilis rhizosphaerae TaxID=2775421 RepID=A0ABR9DNZ2_9MICO|nr:gluconokinase [Flavimobilis rhizosphaerae]MBD9698156.1 gluconokinase [Flavimobilis rhizosphaerae]
MTHSTSDTPPPRIVVMGVSGCGKSTVATLLAARLGVPYVDADDLHPAANVARMSAGIQLTDDDRAPWLDTVAAAIAAAPDGVVVACSALRRSYRDRLRAGAPGTVVVHLDGTPELLAARIGARTDHFMPASLLGTQLATLESLADDEPGTVLDVTATPDELADAAATWWRDHGSAPAIAQASGLAQVTETGANGRARP